MSKTQSANKIETGFKRFDSRYEAWLSRGISFLVGIVVGAILLQSLTSPPELYFAVRPWNQTGIDISYVEVVVEESSVTIPGDQIGRLSPAEHFDIKLADAPRFTVRAKLANGDLVIGEANEVDPGCLMIETIYVDRIEHKIRSCPSNPNDH